jgi:predicted transcriptional regulator
MLVRDISVKDITSVDVKDDVIDALITLFSSRRRMLPVFDRGQFVGTLCISSYAKVLREMENRRPETILVGELTNRNSVIVSPTTEISYVIERVCEKGCYGVPVISGHKFEGIIGREDILRTFLHLLRGKFKAIDVMSYYVSTSSIHDPIETVTKKIITGDARRIVIMDNKNVEGTVGVKDIANILLAEKADLATLSVRDILVPSKAAVHKNDDAAKIAEIMLEWGVGGVPIVDNGLEGIVRDKDILQRLRLLM